MRDTLLLLQTGSVAPELQAEHGDFPRLFAEAMPWLSSPVRVVDAVKGELPDSVDWGAVAITGSPRSVRDREPWLEPAAAWLRRAVAAGRPVLGVCFGHQLLAHALGGRVEASPGGPELGAWSVDIQREDPLLEGLPDAFGAWQIHYDAVVEPPPGSVVLASSPRTPVQVLAYPGPVRSVQFHPEFRRAFVAAALERHAPLLDKVEPGGSGRARDTLGRPVHTDDLLRRFVEEFTELAVG